MIDNVVVPVASGYGLAEEYQYLKSSIREFLTGWYPITKLIVKYDCFYLIGCRIISRYKHVVSNKTQIEIL